MVQSHSVIYAYHSDLVSCAFSTIPICPFLIQRIFYSLVAIALASYGVMHVSVCRTFELRERARSPFPLITSGMLATRGESPLCLLQSRRIIMKYSLYTRGPGRLDNGVRVYLYARPNIR